jgi:predicted nucleic acid-binding protein
VIPTISMYEVYERIVLQRDEEEALSAIGWMAIGQVADLTQEIALMAADLSLEHKLPMADSIILATTRAYNATLWTQDQHFKDLADVKYVEKS